MHFKFKNYNKIKILILILFFVAIGINFGEEIAKRVVKGDDLLAFIGAVIGSGIGVLGALFIYRIQSENETERIKTLNSNFIKELLIFTVSETDSLIEYIMNSYISLFIQKTDLNKETFGFLILKEQLQETSFLNLFKSDYEKKTFPYMIDEVMRNEYSFKTYKNPDINKPINIINKDIIKFKQKDIRAEILEEYKNKSDFKDIIYDENWCQYIHNIGHIEFKDIRVIIRWLTILSKNIDNEISRIDKTLEKIDLLEKENKDLKSKSENENKDEDERLNALSERFDVNRAIYTNKKKQQRLEKEISKNICDFIYYRDEIILILQKSFNFDSFNTSTKVLNNKFEEIEKKF